MTGNMMSFKRTILFLVFIILQWCDLNTAASISYAGNPDYNLFASDLFSVVVDGKTLENIVYSPTSIQTSLALAFMGAEGETAKEMRHVLRLGKGDKIQIAQEFCNFVKSSLNTANTTDDFPKFQMANRLYVNDQLKVSSEFNKIALQYFDSEAEEVDFSDQKTVVEKVNHWVQQQTENKIKDVLKEDSVNADTNAVLVNAIYFKAEWLNPFSISSTSTSQFYFNSRDSTEAEIMYNEHFFAYGELPELDATALEMPYNNSDISMLIILPNKIEGLENLELKLRNKDLSYITDHLEIRKVHAHIPKFRIEFEIDLKEPLEKMGLTTAFTSAANFKSLFATPEYQSISEVKHKAFLDVNEAGSEAAAATFGTLTNLSGFFDEPIFRANHPFIFAIHSKSAVYFAGHVATI